MPEDIAIYTLRPYQQEAVERTVSHFRKTSDPAVIVLPTGAGKSLVIAELARLARKKILVLAHVKELVEQNAGKYRDLGCRAGIFSAGLKQKSLDHQVTFASVQSLSRNLEQLDEAYSLLVIDECHRVSGDEKSQYGLIIARLKEFNPGLKILGLTATPYRLGTGWIYRRHYHGFVRGTGDSPFVDCIYELPLRYMIKSGFLTPPEVVDAAIAHYDFASLASDGFGRFSQQDLNQLLQQSTRATRSIVSQVMELAENRQGVMIFAATVEHAKEILSYLSNEQAALVTGETEQNDRDGIINDFKQKKIKFLVNVSVLTTGFDAPHVDFIAILRPTESVSLYQQIVGRGLRLSPGKENCLVIDYAGNGFDLFHPEVGNKRPGSDSEPVQVICPGCGFGNTFWGKLDEQGKLVEHFGRRCQGLLSDDSGYSEQCDYRFRFKECDHCGAENDIAARRCHQCREAIVDPDDKLRKALNLKDALVLRCSGMSMEKTASGKLKLIYYDEDGASCDEYFDFSKPASKAVFERQFARRFANGREKFILTNEDAAVAAQQEFVAPDFVIARKAQRGWRVAEKLFDYQGAYRKAHQL